MRKTRDPQATHTVAARHRAASISGVKEPHFDSKSKGMGKMQIFLNFRAILFFYRGNLFNICSLAKF